MSTIEVKVPDIGDYDDVPVIEVHVKPGEAVKAEQALLTLESDKATMDVPSPSAGTVKDVRIKVGDRVKQGTVVVMLDAAEGKAAAAKPAPSPPAPAPAAAPAAAPPPPAPAPRATAPAGGEERPAVAHASPAVRKFARELGVDVRRVEGSGTHGRILKEDVQRFVKETLNRPSGGAGDRKSTRLNASHQSTSRMPSSA